MKPDGILLIFYDCHNCPTCYGRDKCDNKKASPEGKACDDRFRFKLSTYCQTRKIPKMPGYYL
jgi:hypothetical protein